MQSITNIIQLRQLLAERFPNLRMLAPHSPARAAACWPTGLAQIDDLLRGGLPKSGITELISERLGSGSALVMRALLRRACQTHQWVVLVDGQDCFDPAPLENALLSRLLWVRCRDAAQALRATDLLLRDGNLPLVLLDLRLNPALQLRKIPATTWYRLQRLIEPTATALLVVTPRALVSGAQARLSLDSRFTLDALLQTEEELLPQLNFELVRSTADQQREPLVAQAG